MLLISDGQAYSTIIAPRALMEDSEANSNAVSNMLLELDQKLTWLYERRDQPIQFIPGSPEAAEYLGTDYWVDNDGTRHPYVPGTVQG
jgi:hypothetical protein